MTNRPALLIVILLMGIFSLFGCSKTADLDESVCIQLRKAGSDLSKPHQIEFFIYFPTQAAAEQAASRIRDGGFQVEVQKAAKGDAWLCFTTKTMVPDLAALQKIGRDFGALAVSLKGDYDGWGTEVGK
jgi:hypothetical protein